MMQIKRVILVKSALKYKIYTHVNENPTDFRPWGYNFCANDGSSGFCERKSAPKVLDVGSGRSTRRNNCRVVSQCILCRYQTARERKKCSFYPWTFIKMRCKSAVIIILYFVKDKHFRISIDTVSWYAIIYNIFQSLLKRILILNKWMILW